MSKNGEKTKRQQQVAKPTKDGKRVTWKIHLASSPSCRLSWSDDFCARPDSRGGKHQDDPALNGSSHGTAEDEGLPKPIVNR